MTQPRHRWISGPGRTGSAAGLTGGPLLTAPINAHRRLRGPYTAAGTLLRSIVPAELQSNPTLPPLYDIEILAAAPELAELMPMARTTLTSTAEARERTRFYGADRTAQLANGIAEFLIRYLAATSGGLRLVVENAAEADHSDQELLATLLRRISPEQLQLIVDTGSAEPLPVLAEALSQYADHHRADHHRADPQRAGQVEDAEPSAGSTEQLAAAYVGTECLASNAEWLRAYDALPDEDRARLHDERADQLAGLGELSLRLGAIPFHRLRGSDPHGAGAAALEFAIEHCSVMGFYPATIELTALARPVVDWDRPKLNHLVTARRALALIMTGRADEAEPLYQEARLFTADPEMHMMAAYSTAMLYTRYLDRARQDQDLAIAWINQAIAFATTYAEPANRAFQTVFMQNGKALIETHRGNLPEALRLVEEGLARLDTELAADAHRLHRSVLIFNSGQVRAALGDLEGAVADFTEAINRDPHYAPYYFDRAGLQHRLGRDEEAIADYEAAIRMSPPLPEAHYNRGDIRAQLGDPEGALADFEYAVELSPNFVNAHLYRASVLSELGRDAEAAVVVRAGLSLDPANPHLLALQGQLAATDGDEATAEACFRRVTELDPAVEAAWAGLAAIAFDRGEPADAVSYLSKALELMDSAALRFNRAAAYIAADRWREALDDLIRAGELDPSDPDVAQERDRCLAKIGN